MSLSAELAGQILEFVEKNRGSIPVWDKTTNRVSALLSHEKASVKELTDLIETDPVLATRILNQANSPAYAGAVKMKTIDRAIMRLGFETVRNLFLTSMLKDIFKPKHPILKECYKIWWKHSLSCAVGSRSLAEHIGKGEIAGEAYLIGLLHDMGVVVILTAIDHFCKDGEMVDEIGDAALREFIHETHARIGASVLSSMHFDGKIQKIVATHTTPDDYETQTDLLFNILQVENNLLAKTGITLHPNPGLSIMNLPYTQFLNLDPVFVALQEVEIEDSLENLEQLLA
ncbi:TPA: hypothetical protein DDW35_10720 [Candidatus Sumerlaeota bacterium]|jgi:HD-like signal output (HDOD) protein|nr:hypothetical protein [Candidatus Sumerlaeota bacterium]